MSETVWEIEGVVHFAPGDLCKGGFVHFGFHDRAGRQYVVGHEKHFLGLVGEDDRLEWTVANAPVLEGVPNIRADLQFPMYVDSMLDGTLIVSNLGSGRLYRVDVTGVEATLFVEGSALGMKDAGNCVVDDEGNVWVNEVVGCRVRQFDATGGLLRTLGDGEPGFQLGDASFSDVRFHWIYDIRKGPDGNIYVLDSRNFAVRMIDLENRCVRTIAGTGEGGYTGDGGAARFATFGSSPEARFDGPISLSVDEDGNIFVGDRHNHVVRMIDRETGVIATIAGRGASRGEEMNDPSESDPLRLSLPEISSMDYHDGRLFIPTDLKDHSGDLIVLREARNRVGT